MRTIALCAACIMAPVLSLAQEFTLRDAKKEIRSAKVELEEAVVFCKYCRASGEFNEAKCVHCDGRGIVLKCEERLIAHRRQLELKAQRAGLPKERYSQFDIADRLSKFEDEIESQTLELLPAYLEFLKAHRKNKDLLKEDEKFKNKVEETIEILDKLIDMHGPRLRLRCLKMLYEDDPTGKVGIFNLYGKKGQVRIDGQDVERLEMRTLRDCSILIMKAGAKERNGFILAEIIGKETYKTDDGKEIAGILMQAY